MPARRRGQEARRAQRRASRLPEPRPEWQPTEDQVWAEHQADERLRRAPEILCPPPRIPFDIRPALARVLADFARWEREREDTA